LAIQMPTFSGAPKSPAEALGVTRRWVQRRARRLPFARRLSEHAVRYSESGLRRWMENRRMRVA
jgi:predicted DNA-binding transcriptional regulator AlpA